MNRIWRILAVLTLFVAILPTFAQDEAEEETPVDPSIEMLATVESILEEMRALPGIRIDGLLTVKQNLRTGGTSVDTTFAQDIDLSIGRNGDQVEQVQAKLIQDLNLGLGIGRGSFTMDLILPKNDDNFYARLSDFSGLMLDMAPQEWVIVGSDVEEAEFINETFPSNIELLNSFSRVIDYPLTDETVLAVRERRAQPIRYERHDYAVRRIEVEFDVNKLLELGILDSALATVDASALELNPDELLTALLDGATLSVNFYIDNETGYFRRIETLLTYDTSFIAMGQEVQLVQTSEGRFTYSQFGSEFDFQVPADFVSE
jgi:hypothetical protein